MSQSTHHESTPNHKNTLENTPPTAPPPLRDGDDDPQEDDPFYDDPKVRKDSHRPVPGQKVSMNQKEIFSLTGQ